MEYQDSFSMIETEDQKTKKIRYSSRKALIQIKKHKKTRATHFLSAKTTKIKILRKYIFLWLD